MADYRDVLRSQQDVQDALSILDSEDTLNHVLVVATIAIVRAIQGLGVRIDHAISSNMERHYG